jgi:hypothetical protein
MIHSKLSQTKKNGWRAIKYSSLCFEALVETLYFLFIVSSSKTKGWITLGPNCGPNPNFSNLDQ